MSKQGDTSEKPKSAKLDKTKQSEIKEKSYNTKQVETSIAILESPENDVVLEAILFLSKYADVNKNNTGYLVKHGLVPKLCNNLKKNICILRISLRLLCVLLNSEDALFEIDQEKYDASIIEISTLYVEHKDTYVKEFCTEILAKIAPSFRINTLIFKTDLLNPIFENMKTTKNLNVLFYTLLLFFELMDAPAAVSSLPEAKNFDPAIIILHLNHNDTKISNLVLDVLEKLTGYGLPFLQEGFKHVHLVEKMLNIIMDELRSLHHDKAVQILHNCLDCDETCSYFIESVEFLELCQWVKSCAPNFLLPMIEVFVKLSTIPEIRQILFDLSVEESILYFFRSINKKIINQTCTAVSNMTTHKYCCESMLTPVIASTLIDVLNRQNDEEDPYNEVALRTIFHFSRRHVRALDVFISKGLQNSIMNYFQKGYKVVSEETFLMVLEIIYKCMVHPVYQGDFVSTSLFADILKLFQEPSVPIATMCCEMMSNQVPINAFRHFFLENNGAAIFIKVMSSAQDINLLTNILFFIFSSLIYEDLAIAFLHNGLLATIRSFSESVINKVPIAKKVLHLAFNYYLPIKFFEINRLELTDKLPNKFYILTGPWNGPFPFLEILEAMYVSPIQTIYLVDYSYEVVKETIKDTPSQSTLKSSKSLFSTVSSRSSTVSSISLAQSVCDVNYGRLSSDPFLPRYIYHIKKYDRYMQGSLQDRIRFLAEYVDTLLCGPKDGLTLPQKIHEYKLHIECLKNKLGNNVIPIGYLRLGFHCEKALLFKAMADKIGVPCSLVKGNNKFYWNEVAIFEGIETEEKLKFYVVDLMVELGNLMLVGSREANKYCNIN